MLEKNLVQEYCVWLHVDFISAGDIRPADVQAQTESFAMKELRRLIRYQYPSIYPRDGNQLRDLFAAELAEAEMTQLHGLRKDSEAWNSIVNSIITKLYEDDFELVRAVLRRERLSGRRVVIVLDNTDQLGERVQESVFLLSQNLSKRLPALTIVSLREEKFFAAFRRGIFDAYGDRRFHIGSPDLKHVIRKRLEYAMAKFKAQADDIPSRELIASILSAFIRSTTSKNQNIVRMLACISNGNIRLALSMFKEFVSSGNTDIDKILSTIAAHGKYVVPFHEFAKSAILGSRRYYKSANSNVINLFLMSSAPRASHLTGCQILARLSNALNAPSPHGEGYVETVQLLAEARKSFGTAQDFILKLDELLRHQLIESEPPRAEDTAHTDALRISACGQYYWRYLVRSFAYLDLMLTDTPILNKETAQTLASMVEVNDLSSRFERVRLFLGYLDKHEKETSAGLPADSVYRTPIITGVVAQVEGEIAVIKKRTGARDISNDDDDQDDG